ncbi:MAG: hypothetical protein JNK05_16495 [Myxococcales bacterium]|nr:hypothetical protein [Myxococcales bacterium]
MTSSSRVTFGRAFVLAVVPALLLSRCGLWPSFPDNLIAGDGGTTDVRTDGSTDGRADGEAGMVGDGSLPDATVDDVPSDVPPATWNGFRACPAAPTMMLTPEPAFPPGDGGANPLARIASARDITFDGQGEMLIVGRDTPNTAVFTINSSGVVRPFFSAPQGFFFGARYLTDGRVVVTGSFQTTVMGMNVTLQGVTLLSPTGSVESRLPFDTTGPVTGTPWGSVAHPNGSFLVIDSTNNQIIPFGSGMLPATPPTPVNTATAMPPAPDAQRAAIYSADYRKLYIVAATNNLIHEYNVAEDGTVDGNSRRVYASLPASSFPRSLAFDECGNLYVTLSVPGTPATGALVRIPPRGGTPFTLATFDTVDAQRTIAFGAGPGFSETSIYIADSSGPLNTARVLRVDVGITGQPIVRPRMMMMRDM